MQLFIGEEFMVDGLHIMQFSFIVLMFSRKRDTMVGKMRSPSTE
jgi:hypothetical protein